MLRKFTGVVKGMHVYEKRMLKNLNATGGLFNSEAVMLAAVKAGMEKDAAYTAVQAHAMDTWEKLQNDELSSEDLGTFYQTSLKNDAALMQYLTPEDIDRIFHWQEHLRHIEIFYQRLGIEELGN